MYKVRKLKIEDVQCEALALASGDLYSRTVVCFWRTVRKHNLWLKPSSMMRWQNSGQLHAHSADAIVQSFYAALKSWRVRRKDDPESKPPHQRRRFYRVQWKNSAIRLRDGHLWLSNGKGNEPLVVPWQWETPTPGDHHRDRRDEVQDPGRGHAPPEGRGKGQPGRGPDVPGAEELMPGRMQLEDLPEGVRDDLAKALKGHGHGARDADVSQDEMMRAQALVMAALAKSKTPASCWYRVLGQCQRWCLPQMPHFLATAWCLKRSSPFSLMSCSVASAGSQAKAMIQCRMGQSHWMRWIITAALLAA